MPTRVFGWIAVTLSLIYKFPQIYKLQKTRDTRGISVGSQIIQASAYGFYIVHGSIIGDPPVVLLGITSLSQSIVLIVQYFCYRGRWEKATREDSFEERNPKALEV
mmetsp:Transcript_22538/g.45032  ORF Transcript_22538/g.45032 Transcript_22538/m.45032 type:complete len:106 (+) Transcript_22538:120-437(+)|eukprot:CAMPEP_0182465922 /NCGR_PEP_ID=MMETSP1319-20130603/10952_1 /TAXON_ID=172717 /ORGANISM="Bolidomonas pacifica, Strain RCC208" /LENGTH=105 /DNA_ID=CAMNT_0024665813 /DNA_START=112 /DNA_END=429 /DNA_ORIENTATION=+